MLLVSPIMDIARVATHICREKGNSESSQKCHLKYDHADHIQHAKENRLKKKLEKQPLLLGIEQFT